MTRIYYYIAALAALAALAFMVTGLPDLTAAIAAGSVQLAVFGPALLERKAAGDPDLDDPVSEIKHLIEAQGEAWTTFKAKHEGRVDELQKQLDQIHLKSNRPFGNGNDIAPAAPTTPAWFDTKSQREVKVLNRDQSMMTPAEVKDTPSIGRVLRGLVLGGKAHDAKQLEDERKALGISADPSGGYTVAGALSNLWIDRLRSAMVLTRAGAMTVPMETGDLALARVTGDPTVSWHGENSDIDEASATFGAVNLKAKTCVCLVKMSLELSQDSANIDQILERVLIASMAQGIDAAGLVGVTTNAGAAPSTGAGVFGISGRNTVISVGAPTSWDFVVDGMYELMNDNVSSDSIGALIGHPVLWKKMRKLKTGLTNDNTPLTMPEEVARLPKLWTTAAPTDKAVIADWRDLLFGVRQQITVQLLTQRFMADKLQLAVLAYARVDFAPARAASFCTMEGITTS